MKPSGIVLCLSIALLSSCGSSTSFSGGSGRTGSSVASSDRNGNPAATADAETSPTPLPTKVIKKGSFTVWTVPQDPGENEPYEIMIRVDYGGRSVDPLKDLKGLIRGTDSYRQEFGKGTCKGAAGAGLKDDYDEWDTVDYSDGDAKFESTDEQVDILPERLDANTISMYVPGGKRRVRDTIDVCSTTIKGSKGKQSIRIEF